MTIVRYPQLRLGTAPDSWGVWFADDPAQLPWDRYLDEAHEAGYALTELGPFGYLPSEPGRLGEELARRSLTLTGGTVAAALHRGPQALADAKAECAREASTLTPLGARFVVLLPEGYTEADGSPNQPRTLSADQWTMLNDGASQLGGYVRDELGLELVVHPHADTHLGSQPEIERFLDATDPDTVHLCLDTGHVSYCGGDNLALIGAYGPRIRYVHLKSVDQTIRRRVLDEGLDFGAAVRLGAMVEPPAGEPEMPAILEALAGLGRELFCIVEQDLYPCPPEVPLPIATRTRAYYEGAGLRLD